jgi:tRNA pseudouridine synthase 10
VTRAKGGLVSVSRGRILPSKPTRLPSFRFRTRIKATAGKAVDAERLADVSRRFRRAEVRFDRPHERPTSKMVYMAQAKKRGRTVTIEAVLDGGLPVKRFVSGELVSPSVSEVLKTEVRCRTFDIREVKETGEFGFAKITRV